MLDYPSSIPFSRLWQLTGVKLGKVKEWMSQHKVEIDSYNAGYSSRQNVGKPDLRSVIKWSEQAYGAYDW